MKCIKGCKKLYISWDAASWHMSKKLIEYIDSLNRSVVSNKRPSVELVPLPASAQFLNINESIFSGLARAVIHNSNYASVDDAKKAIDLYISERNKYFKENPRRAGKKIWGHERVQSTFSDSNNCKDPIYR